MIINIVKFIPQGWIVKDLKDKIEVWYENKRPQNNPKKKVIFNKIIKIDEKFMEGLGLYLGDGDLNRKEKGHLTFASKDKDIAKHALKFLKDKFDVDIKDITFLVQYKKENKNLSKDWSEYLNISKNKILKRFSERHRKECISIQVNSVIFRKMFEIVVKEVLNKKFINNKKLRRGLIRGLFATEGNLGIDYLENKDYISQIDFNLNINENHIEKLIKNILNEEQVLCSVRNNEKDNSKVISIYNWKNYKKLWEINLFNLCKRKKDKFIKILNRLSIYCFVEENFLRDLFNKQNLKQKELAKLLGSWQPNISRMIKGEHQLLMERFHLLNKRINQKNYFDKIEKIRIGSLTYLENNKENKKFIKYLFNFKLNKKI